MLAFGIRYLNGFVAACEPDSHDRPEWPPHPARVFMALAAAYFETGKDPSERRALEWLEGLDDAPIIHAGEATPRALVTHYVPVNDRAGPAKAILQSAPSLTRDRQARTFARSWLESDVVGLSWPSAEPPTEVRDALSRLCAKVTRIGHSSSFVSMWVESEIDSNRDPNDRLGRPTWIPDDRHPETYLRVAGPRTLEYLERCFNEEEVERWNPSGARRASPPVRRRPELRMFRGYARPRPAETIDVAPGGLLDPFPVVRTLVHESGDDHELDLVAVPALARGWRNAILARSDGLGERAKHLLSGHGPDGTPLEGAHLAFLPLAFVGHPHADGHLLGMGIVLPDGLDADTRREMLTAIGRVDRLTLGRLGVWRIARPNAFELPWNLRPEVWTAHPRGATHWGTVTPIAFDTHPKASDPTSQRAEVARMVAEAVVRMGFPVPRDVVTTAVSPHLGAPPGHAFPRIQRKDGSFRRHTHAILVFDEPVRGPMLIGAGRYRGYGVCRPLDEGAR